MPTVTCKTCGKLIRVDAPDKPVGEHKNFQTGENPCLGSNKIGFKSDIEIGRDDPGSSAD
ncbi:MAG: hypothetical protein V1685_07660 [Parcubacteria group bacterium]